MHIPTRDMMIQAGSWPTDTIQVEFGPLKLAKPSADGALLLRALYRKQAKGEDVEREVVAGTLVACAVDPGTGAAAFKSEVEAFAAMAAMSSESVGLVMQAAGKLATPPGKARKAAPGDDEAEADDSPSEASPSAA